MAATDTLDCCLFSLLIPLWRRTSSSSSFSCDILFLILRLSVSSFGFTRASRADTAAQAGQFNAFSGQMGHSIVCLGKLDLELSFARMRVLGEDVEDKSGPVYHFKAKLGLQVPYLGRGEVVVEYHRVSVR